MNYAVACTEAVKEYKSREFASRKEAFEFYVRAQKEDNNLPYPPFHGLDSVRIDSVLITTK
jgi:hypothetical protein